MRSATLVRRGLCHHWRDHLGLLLGVAVGAAVLAGALIVGDSARHTLRRGALLRLGRTSLALAAPGGSFSAELAGRLERRLGVPAAPLLREPAIAVAAGDEGRRQVGRVQLYGVDARFARFADAGAPPGRAPAPAPGEVALGRELAAALGARPGDRVSLRLAVRGLLPSDAPLSRGGGPATILVAAIVSAVVPDEALGRFGLQSAMLPPRNAFVDLAWLQERLGAKGRANLVLLGGEGGGPSPEEAAAALREVFDPGMAGLRVRQAGALALLESERVFLEPAVSAAALGSPRAIGALTYLVNGIARTSPGGGGAVPYSFVTALAPSADPALGPVPPGMRDDEILLNRRSADRLGAGPGDEVALSYSAALPGGGFEERRRAFTVRGVLPMESVAAERGYVPEFPGLTDVERCSDWSIGLPLDDALLRDDWNEAYWQELGATPKAFVTLAAGQAMWENPWGDLTAVRFPGTGGGEPRPSAVTKVGKPRPGPASSRGPETVAEGWREGGDPRRAQRQRARRGSAATGPRSASTRSSARAPGTQELPEADRILLRRGSAAAIPGTGGGEPRPSAVTKVGKPRPGPASSRGPETVAEGWREGGDPRRAQRQRARRGSAATGPRSASSSSAIRHATNLNIPPEAFGLAFRPVRAEALRSAAEATDLGGLFLGMSLFLAASALLLTGLLFAFGIERRAGETGALLALGFTPARVAALSFAEAALVGLAGAALGALAGRSHAAALLAGLRSSWKDAVAGLEIVPHAEPWSMAAGAGGALLAALAAVALTLRRQMRLPARELLAAGDLDGTAVPPPTGAGRGLAAASLATAAAALLVVSSATAGEGDPAASFFAAGTLLLLASLLAARWGLRRLDRAGTAPLSAASLLARGIARRPARSLAVIALLAGGGFIVFAVAALRTGPETAGRGSGGGGFALVGESALPLRAADLAEAARRAGPAGADDAILALKVRDGDDASCLNLNRAGFPPLVGVDPGELVRRGAFAGAGEAGAVWGLLDSALPDGAVPGLAGDADTARWNLRLRTGPERGETIEYRDERGQAFRVRLVGALPVRKSVFQGKVLVPLGAFVRRFPSEEGFRMLLVDAAPGRAGAVRRALGGELGRLGLELQTPAERLAAYYAVERAYQGMFLALGGLGLLLGTAGLAVVVLRNVLERRAELALLAAIGMPRGRIALQLFAEHFALFGAGLAAGILPALVAVRPALGTAGAGAPLPALAAGVLALAAAGAAATLLASLAGTRGPILPALSRE